jgi:hypothetical protein
MVSLRFEITRLRGHHLLRVLESTMYPVSIERRHAYAGDPIFRIDHADTESVPTIVAMVRERCPEARFLDGPGEHCEPESSRDMGGEERSPGAAWWRE